MSSIWVTISYRNFFSSSDYLKLFQQYAATEQVAFDELSSDEFTLGINTKMGDLTQMNFFVIGPDKEIVQLFYKVVKNPFFRDAYNKLRWPIDKAFADLTTLMVEVFGPNIRHELTRRTTANAEIGILHCRVDITNIDLERLMLINKLTECT